MRSAKVESSSFPLEPLWTCHIFSLTISYCAFPGTTTPRALGTASHPSEHVDMPTGCHLSWAGRRKQALPSPMSRLINPEPGITIAMPGCSGHGQWRWPRVSLPQSSMYLEHGRLGHHAVPKMSPGTGASREATPDMAQGVSDDSEWGREGSGPGRCLGLHVF